MTKKIIVVLIASLFLIPNFIFADGGLIPYPPQIQIDETEQNAIVAWNGQEEVFILSVGIRAAAEASVLKIVPLPANPTEVEEGSFYTFDRLVTRINYKLEDYWSKAMSEGYDTPGGGEAAVEITFHQQIGAHNITVAKVNDLDGFIVWVKQYLVDNGLEYYELSSEFKATVADYLGRNIRHFVFDLIEVGETSQSVKPIVYRFPADYLFYPMEITATSDAGATQYSEINLFLITEKEISRQTIRDLGFTPNRGFDYSINFDQDDLAYVSSEIAGLFSAGAWVYQVKYYGRLSSMDRDLAVADLIKTQDNPKVYQVIKGRRYWIPNPGAFNQRRFNWTDVETTRASELTNYQTLKLIRAADDYKVYYLTEAGLKRHVPSIEAFRSYNYDWQDITEVPAVDLAGYSDNLLVRAEDDHRVYKLEGGRRRWIRTATAFNRLGYNWSEIASVSATELNCYPEGAGIE